MPDNPPWLQGTSRKYGFGAQELVKRLGLQGQKVVKVEFSDGTWFLTTWEKAE
jgi:hypothetical protein